MISVLRSVLILLLAFCVRQTGQYFGKFSLTMNTPFNSGAPYLWRIKSTWPADGSEWSYGTLRGRAVPDRRADA